MESTMINDEVMQELITLLRENNMKCETNDTFDICNYIDGLQDKIEVLSVQELYAAALNLFHAYNPSKDLNDILAHKVWQCNCACVHTV